MMSVEIGEAILSGYNKNMEISYPSVIDGLELSDANLEVSNSNSLQPLRLVYCHNIVRCITSIGYVFVMTKLRGFRNFVGKGKNESAKHIGLKA